MASFFQLRLSASIIERGGIIAYPTDTLYGLSCNPYNQQAVERIMLLKQRQGQKSFILLGSDSQLFAPLLCPKDYQQFAQMSAAPSPTSWVVKAKQSTPHWLTANDHTIAIRVSTDPITRFLCQRLQHPLISTSVNISKRTAANSALQCRRDFNLDKILVSPHPRTHKPSRLCRLSDQTILRR